jgi:hypothetical protein
MSTITTSLVCAAQRLAAQPLGHFRFVVTILAGFLKSHSSVFPLSLGQVGCSRGLGSIIIASNNILDNLLELVRILRLLSILQ